MSAHVSSTIAEAKAGADIVRIIGETLALRRQGRDWIALRPFHMEHTPSFTVFSAGHYHCFGCGAHGDVVDWLTTQRGMSFPEARAYLGGGGSGVRAAAAPVAKQHQRNRDSAGHIAAARRIWMEALDPRNSIVAGYLRSRGVELPDEPVLRFHPNCPCGDTRLPAMIALLTDPVTGEPRGVHRTFLQADGSGKAAIPSPKMMLGSWGIIRLYEPETAGIGFAEGIETALNVAQRLSWGPAWSTVNAGGFEKVPPLIERTANFFVDCDDDGVSLRSAEAAARRWVAAGLEAYIHQPPAGQDWADAARRIGS